MIYIFCFVEAASVFTNPTDKDLNLGNFLHRRPVPHFYKTMGKITGCFITLTNNDAAVYRPGETVKGYALLDVEEEVRINSVKIFLTGKALTQWVSSTTAFSSNTKSGLETYVNVFKWLVEERK